MSEWLNTEKVIWKDMVKPCKLCGFCPYGQLVEEFPLKKRRNGRSCEVFGHDCPAFYHAEPISEDKMATKTAIKKMVKEWRDKYPEKKK